MSNVLVVDTARHSTMECPSGHTGKLNVQKKFILYSGRYYTAWKVSKYGVLSGPYFPVFSPNTGKYGPEKTPYLDTFHAVIWTSYVDSI